MGSCVHVGHMHLVAVRNLEEQETNILRRQHSKNFFSGWNSGMYHCLPAINTGVCILQSIFQIYRFLYQPIYAGHSTLCEHANWSILFQAILWQD